MEFHSWGIMHYFCKQGYILCCKSTVELCAMNFKECPSTYVVLQIYTCLVSVRSRKSTNVIRRAPLFCVWKETLQIIENSDEKNPIMNEKKEEFAIERKSVTTMSKELLFRRVTILNWLPKYSRMDAISDAIAGFTVGLTMVPQSIAYAALAGLTAQYGLYSAFMGSFVYVVFGTIKEVSIGPTSLMALLAIEYTQELPVEFVILLAFLAGCVEFLMGVLNLGFLVDFISAPVRSGFTSATALIVSVSQLKGLIGLRFKSHGLPDSIYHIATQAGEIRLWDSMLGLTCVIFLLSFRLLKDIPIGPKDPTKQTPTHRAIKKTLWFISISRNALAVLLCTVAAYAFVSFGPSPFILSGKVQSGLPPFGLPPFSAQVGNTTYTFVEMCSELGSAIVLVPLVAVLANVAIAKAFSSGTTLDATQEMLTLGMCNMLGSCFQSMPTCGAFTRSAVSNASGARTPMVGIYSGSIILLALSFLTPYFYFIPRATLSAVLICAVIFMVEWEVVLPMWRSNKADFFLLVATFTTCLWFGVEMGLLLGIVVNISFLLYLWARPRFAIQLCKSLIETEYVLVSADVGLFYPAANFLHTEMTKAAINLGHGTLPVVLDCNNFRGIDCTIAMGIDMLVKDFAKRKQPIILYNLRDEIIYILHGMDVNFQYCNSQEELLDLFIGEKIDLGRSETLPLIDEKPLVERMQLETEVTPKVNRSLLRSVLSNSRGDLEKTGCDYVDELRRKGSFAE